MKKILLIMILFTVLVLIVVYYESQKVDLVESRGSKWHTPAPARQVKPSNIRGLVQWYFQHLRRATYVPLPSETPWPTPTQSVQAPTLTPLPYPEPTMTVEAYP